MHIVTIIVNVCSPLMGVASWINLIIVCIIMVWSVCNLSP